MTHPIKHYRKLNGLTLEDIGRICGASKSMVSRWENGHLMPDIKRLEALDSYTGGILSPGVIFNAYYSAQVKDTAA
jgi:transcriptional regulator with XRE-family HTH domain